MNGILLRLAGPLQSWGERSVFTAERDTAPFPTRSALIGMFAAAEGRGREQDLDPYAALQFTVRVDRPGERLIDYHTVGGGFPKHLTAATSGGDHKGGAVVTRRHYLADAVFVVAVSGPDPVITRIAAALEQPHWNPYLGRRSCVPDEPFVLRRHTQDPVEELRHRVPLSMPPRNEDGDPTGVTATETPVTEAEVTVDFLWEKYHSGQLPEDALTLSVNDVPTSFAQHGRSHAKRSVIRTTEGLPAELCTHPAQLHQRLIDYAKEEA